MSCYRLETPLGWIGWREGPHGLQRLVLPLPEWGQLVADLGGEPQAPPVGQPVAAAFAAFWAGQPTDLGWIVLDQRGSSPFASAVRQVVRGIPWGATMTYGEVARAAGRPGAARAVGQVMRLNPFAPVVPCHRVLAAAGLGGFGGQTGGRELRLKEQMLRAEGRP
ncbi:MAG: MGMT family protein [Fimbriimonadaceae bacterium]|nr:MGMT family protein [Fimbriimonadaceae bacterium]